MREEKRKKGKKLNLPYDPAKPLFDKYPKGLSFYCRDTCSAMFTDTLFIIARK